jgi:hypothetical protein
MKWLLTILTAFFRALLPWVAKRSQPTAEDADPDRETRDRLRRQVRKHWLIAAVMLPVLLLAGCSGGDPFTRTIYVPHGTPIRLRETVKDVKVWVKDADGEPVAGRMDLAEGWYCLSAESD